MRASKRGTEDLFKVDMNRLDERGRGTKIPDYIEHACIQGLIAAILETAVFDRAMIDELGVDYIGVSGRKGLYRSELDAFAKGKWCEFLLDNIPASFIDTDAAKKGGIARARSIREGRVGVKPRRYYEYKGESHTADEWAQITGLAAPTVRDRWKHRGVKGDKNWLDISPATNSKLFFEWHGATMGIRDICEREGVPKRKVNYRLSKGEDIYEAVRQVKLKMERLAG